MESVPAPPSHIQGPFRATRLALVCLFIATFASSLRANKHEHIYSYLVAGSLEAAYQRVFGRSFEQQKLKVLLSKDGDPRVVKQLQGLWGERVVGKLMNQLGGGEKAIHSLNEMTLQEVCIRLSPLIGVSKEEVQRGFTLLPTESEREKLGIKPGPGYLAREEFSKEFLQNLKKKQPGEYLDFVASAYGHTLDQLKAAGRLPRVVEFSVGDDLTDAKTFAVLRNAFEARGVEAKFLYSYPRYKLIGESEADFNARLEKMRTYLNGISDGVDISGSLGELKSLMDEEKQSETDRLKMKKIFFERLRKIADMVAENGKTLKFHAFESISGMPGIGSDGHPSLTLKGRPAFYGALFQLLDSLQAKAAKGGKVPRIVIGHLANLNESDILRLAQYRKHQVPIEIDANLLSNEILQGKSIRELARKVAFLLSQGIPVSLGGDGQGILSANGHDLPGLLVALRSEFERMEFSPGTIARYLDQLKSVAETSARGTSPAAAGQQVPASHPCGHAPCPVGCLAQ